MLSESAIGTRGVGSCKNGINEKLLPVQMFPNSAQLDDPKVSSTAATLIYVFCHVVLTTYHRTLFLAGQQGSFRGGARQQRRLLSICVQSVRKPRTDTSRKRNGGRPSHPDKVYDIITYSSSVAVRSFEGPHTTGVKSCRARISWVVGGFRILG